MDYKIPVLASGPLHKGSTICSKWLQEFFNEISMAFNTNIQIIAIDWSEEALLKVCSDLSPKRSLEAKVVSVFGYPPIEFLNENNWVTLLSAGS
jgi:hypothetical protein